MNSITKQNIYLIIFNTQRGSDKGTSYKMGSVQGGMACFKVYKGPSIRINWSRELVCLISREFSIRFHLLRVCHQEGIETKTSFISPLDISTVHGDWASWLALETCSQSCGGGTQSYWRSCTSPSPKFGGLFCAGDGDETRDCNVHPCPGIHASRD